MTEDWSNEPVEELAVAPVIAEIPEVKLFGKWSCEDVSVSDMSGRVAIRITPLAVHVFSTQLDRRTV